MENSFIDKVFDAYLKSDYSYKDDNLNPKREITRNTSNDTDESLGKILDRVQAKIQEIGKKYKEPDKLNTVRLNLNNDGKNINGRKVLDLIPSEDENDPGYTGILGAPTGIDSALIEIDNIIPKILVSLNPPPTPVSPKSKVAANTRVAASENLEDDNQEDPEYSEFDQPNLYKIDCSGTIIENLGESAKVNPLEDEENISTNNSDNSVEFDDKAKEQSLDGSNSRSVDNMSDARDKFLEESSNQIDRNNASARECALSDLKILKMISSVLRILRNVKDFIDSFVNPTMEVCQILVLASQCWVNPVGISEILNRILQKVQAILIMVTCKLLQLLWNLLGLDCITSQVQDTIINIKAILSGVSSIFSEVDKTAISLGNSFDKMEDAFDKVEESVNEALKYSLSDRLKDQLDVDELAAGITNFDKNFEAGLKEQLGSTDAYKSIMDTIELAKSISKSEKDTADSYLKMVSKDSEVNKFVSRFSGITAK